jgi:hypothetical protein
MVKASGWNLPLLVTAGLSVVGALIYAKVDASKRVAFA